MGQRQTTIAALSWINHNDLATHYAYTVWGLQGYLRASLSGCVPSRSEKCLALLTPGQPPIGSLPMGLISEAELLRLRKIQHSVSSCLLVWLALAVDGHNQLEFAGVSAHKSKRDNLALDCQRSEPEHSDA